MSSARDAADAARHDRDRGNGVRPGADAGPDEGRRTVLRAGAALTGVAAFARPSAALAQGKRTFRWAFPAAETGFDPAQISDLYSNYVVSNVYEAPLQYDYLARPAVFKPKTAARMPDISADFRTLTVRIRPGIFFQDDPAFRGQRRELTAADHVYQLKRVADPRWKSPLWPSIETSRIVGLADLRKAAQAAGRFDYDHEIDGIRVLDRFTFQIRLEEPSPRFHENLTDARVFAGVAREVVEFYGNEIMAHPVGTGPFRLAQWKRSSFIALERNEAFREEVFDAQPAADDAVAQDIWRRLKGRKLPIVDRVELSVIEESQPRWLAFLNGEQDTVNVPLDFINIAAPNGKIAPSLAKRGIVLDRLINPDVVVTFFNMEHPLVGGYTPEKIALRRAISLGYDLEEEIRLIRRGSMMPAQSQVPPLTSGYDPTFVSEMSRFDRAGARALLDTYGYVDRDGDGWREQPDGSPLLLEIATESSQLDRTFNELWKRQLDALGLRVQFRVNQWPENAKAARAGKLMIWLLGWTAGGPDPDSFLALGLSRNIGGSNYARFRLPEYDRLYDRQRQLPDGAERDAVIREMKRLFNVYMPYKVHGHRYVNDVMHSWLAGYHRHPFARDFFKYVDVDTAVREGA
jgi:ABC-type transport system substrate-binding protein